MSGRLLAWLAAVSLVGLAACGGGGGGGSPAATLSDVQATPREGYVQVTWSYPREASRFEIFRETVGTSAARPQQLDLIHTVTDPEPPGPYEYNDTAVDSDSTYAYAVAVDGGAPEPMEGSAVSPEPGNTLRVLFGSSVPGGADVSITSEPAGISCSESGEPGCEASFAAISDVALTAQAEGLAATWENCDQATGQSCVVRMTTSRSVTVSFSAANTLSVDVEPDDAGTVTNQNDLGSNPDVSCDDACSYAYPPGLTIGLRAQPVDADHYELAGWGGACAAAGGTTCTVTMDGDRSVDAQFQLIPPEILGFSADEPRISAGGTSTLSWNVAGGGDIGAGELDITIEPSVGSVSARSGSVQVTPEGTTQYTLTASNETATETQTVTVVVGSGALIESFDAHPEAITPFQSSTLTWTLSGTDSAQSPLTVILDPGGIDVTDEDGSFTVEPNDDTTYTLTASNEFGTDAAQVTVRVGLPPFINGFSAEPSAINPGDGAELSWEVEGEGDVTVSLDQEIGDVTGTSSTFVEPADDTTYTLTATSQYGSSSDQATVRVGEAPTIDSFVADPEEIPAGGSSTLQWSVSGDGPFTYTIDQGVGEVDGTSVSVEPGATTTYTLEAQSAFGEDRETVTVTVTMGAAPTIHTFEASPKVVGAGDPVALTWTVSGSEPIELFLEPVERNVSGQTGTEVHPEVTTQYRLTATNELGSDVARVTVAIGSASF